MPGNLQALGILVLAILPGFVAAVVDKGTRPVRKHSTMELLVWCVFYSAIVHSLLIPCSTLVAVLCFHVEPAFVIKIGFRAWLEGVAMEDLLAVELAVVAYFLASIVLAVLLGLLVATFTYQAIPVWYAETAFRIRKLGRFQRAMNGLRRKCIGWMERRYKGTLSVMVEMTNGDTHIGTLTTVPTDHDVLIGTDKDFCIEKVTLLPKGDPEVPVDLRDDESVLLNTRDVVSMRIVEETWGE